MTTLPPKYLAHVYLRRVHHCEACAGEGSVNGRPCAACGSEGVLCANCASPVQTEHQDDLPNRDTLCRRCQDELHPGERQELERQVEELRRVEEQEREEADAEAMRDHLREDVCATRE